MNVIKQLMGKMTSDINTLTGCLSAPWDTPEVHAYPTINHIVHQELPGHPYPTQGEWAHMEQGRCTHDTSPLQIPVSQGRLTRAWSARGAAGRALTTFQGQPRTNEPKSQK